VQRVWKRASGAPLLLTVAAVSAITLAASSPIYSAVSTGDAECSAAQALEVATRLHLVPDPTLPSPVARVLCGAIAGSGSETMVAIFARGTCLPNYGWAAFRFTGGQWQLVPNGSQTRFVSALVAVGSDLRETVPIWRPGDGPCNPKGGTRARVWHWDGTRLVAGPWSRVTKGEAVTRTFFTPSKNIWCSLGDSSEYLGVSCTSLRAPQTVRMGATGRLKICRGHRCPGCGCAPEGVPTLRYGRQTTAGRFRCVSRRSGVTCTVISSGKGFLINRDRVVRVG
jgi:hypothetical protein